MLRALFERRRDPRPGARHQRRRAQRALVARDPDPGVVDRLIELWRGVGESRGDGLRRAARCAPVRRAVRHRHPHLLGQADARAARGGARRHHASRTSPVPVPVLRGQHRAGRGALVRLRAGWSTRVVASAAVPGLLPPAKVGDEHYLDGGIVNSIPLGSRRPARRGPGVRAPGRPDRPAAEAAAQAVGGRPGVLRDRPAAPVRARAGRAARRRRVPRAPAARHLERDDTIRAARDFGSVQRRIEATYDASVAAYLEDAPLMRSSVRCTSGSWWRPRSSYCWPC